MEDRKFVEVEYINPFVSAMYSVFETLLGTRPVKGDLTVQPSTFASQECNVVCGITGQAQGQVIYGMSLVTADKIASAMLGGPIGSFDQLAASAIGEMGNMISGNAMQHMHEAGWVCDITLPTIIRGSSVAINMLSIPAIVIPFTIAQGDVFVTIGLQSGSSIERTQQYRMSRS